MNTHECGIDCKLIIDYTTGNAAHVMYPAQPNGHAGRYQAAKNLGMTRREYRASGQFPTRNIRIWDRGFRERRWTGFSASELILGGRMMARVEEGNGRLYPECVSSIDSI